MKLVPDLIPTTTWYDNIRSKVSTSVWDKIRKKSYKKANYKCEICGGVGIEHPVECHEVWKFDLENKTQTLIEFKSVCPLCHKVIHLGRTNILGESQEAIQHMMKINNITIHKLLDILEDAFILWENRSEVKWKVNTDYINVYLEEDI